MIPRKLRKPLAVASLLLALFLLVDGWFGKTLVYDGKRESVEANPPAEVEAPPKMEDPPKVEDPPENPRGQMDLPGEASAFDQLDQMLNQQAADVDVTSGGLALAEDPPADPPEDPRGQTDLSSEASAFDQLDQMLNQQTADTDATSGSLASGDEASSPTAVAPRSDFTIFSPSPHSEWVPDTSTSDTLTGRELIEHATFGGLTRNHGKLHRTYPSREALGGQPACPT